MGKTTTSRYDVVGTPPAPGRNGGVSEALHRGRPMAMPASSQRHSVISLAPKGMSQVARDAGLSRESLYKALSGERAPGSTPF